jgi:chaperonin GroES
MGLKLIGNRVLLRPRAKDTVSAGGIILGESGDKPQEAEVIACGPGETDYTMTVKVGDQIMHGKYAGTEIEINKETLLIMPESDILVVLGDDHE